MLMLLCFFIAIMIALCLVVPFVGIPLLILGILHSFTIGFVSSIWESYKKYQRT